MYIDFAIYNEFAYFKLMQAFQFNEALYVSVTKSCWESIKAS